jgi:hypothetical protein
MGNKAKDVLDMGGFIPMRYFDRINVPNVGQLFHMYRIQVIAETGELSIAARLSIVLSCWLAIHLKYATSWLADQSPEEIDVIDLACCRGGLIRLIYSLQRRRKQSLSRS